MSDPARLFIALYTDEDITSELAPALRERGFEAQSAAAGQSHAGIIISSEQYSRRRFGELLRLTLRVMNTVTVDEMRDAVVYLQQFK